MPKCKTGLYRVRQLLAAREDDCGIPGYIDPNGKAVEVQVSPTFNETINMIENNVARKTLTRTPNIPGLKAADLAFTAWAKGSGNAAVEPAFGIYLEGCGFQPIALERLNISVVTGTFEVREIVTGGTSGATGIVRVLPRKGQSILYVEVVSGTFQAETITGGTSGATATVDSFATEGFKYRPMSEEFQNLTIRSEEDGVLCKEGNGFLGNFTLTGDNSNPASFDFSFSGRIGKYFRVTTDIPTAEPVLAGSTLTWANGSGTVVANYDVTNDSNPYLIYELDSGDALVNGEVVITGSGASGVVTGLSISTGGAMLGTPDGNYILDQGVGFSTSGSGTGAQIEVTVASDTVSAIVGITNGGASFAVSDTITILDFGVGSILLNPELNVDSVSAGGAATFNTTSKSVKTIDTCPLSDGTSFDPTIPPIVQCADFTANGYKPVLQQFVLDMQNEVVVREDLNSCTGNQPATITSRNPQLTFNPEVFDVNDWDVYQSWCDGELVTGFDLWIGKEFGNRIFIQMDKVQVQSIADGDRDGTAIFDITASVISTEDDGELSIYFL